MANSEKSFTNVFSEASYRMLLCLAVIGVVFCERSANGCIDVVNIGKNGLNYLVYHSVVGIESAIIF